MVRGRYMFRVDDVVRPAGCSNKTGGTCRFFIPLLFNFENSLHDILAEEQLIIIQSFKFFIERKVKSAEKLQDFLKLF